MNVIFRSQAIKLGMKIYFTGKPCIYGHIAYRSIKGVCLECKKVWHEKNYGINREKIILRTKLYYKTNKEKVRTRQKIYIKNNQEKRRAAKQLRRSRDKHVDGQYNGKDIYKLMEMQKSKCAICKISIKEKYHIDHIVPLALGGNNKIHNIQLLCPSCNLRKGAKHPINFMQDCGFLI